MKPFAIRLALIAALVMGMCLPAVIAFAQAPQPAASQNSTPEALVKELIDADYGRKGEIASAMAASKFPQAAAIINAMVEGTLYATPGGQVVIEPSDAGNPYLDALSGKPASGINADTLNKIGANNSLRRELRGIAARVSLLSPDASVRREAAAAAFQAHDADSLPGIETALKVETESDIKIILSQARASIILQSVDAGEKDKLDAITVMTRRGDQDAINVLLGAAVNGSEKFRAAATDAASDIQTTLSYWIGAQNIYYGISLGSVLLLAAIGLAITFGVMGVINMAHGEMIMLGAYTTYVVQQTLATAAPALMPFSLPIALPLAFLVAGAVGVLIERFIIRFLYGRPLETLLATWGVSLVLQQTIRSIFGPTNKAVSSPSWMSGSFDVGHMVITYSRLWIIVFALFVLCALMMFLKRTRFGLQMRAVTQNRKMASAMGVRTNWVDALTFALGSGVAGIAGVALSQIDNVSPNLGQSYIVDSFMVVVFGGVGNLWGTLVGALTLGVANKFLEPYAGAVVGKILVLIFIILFIQRRPRGLFALKGRAIET